MISNQTKTSRRSSIDAFNTSTINSNRSNNNLNTTNTSNITTFPYPPCWSDNERMEVLLAPFRLRSVNPEHYDSKMKFWQNLIADYCIYKGVAHFCKRELQLYFARGKRMPNCLDAVLTEMLYHKRIRSRYEYEYDPADTWSGWAINSFVKKPLAWGFYKIKSSVGLTAEGQEGLYEYVHLDIIRQFCRDLETKVLEKQRGKLLHYDVLKVLVAEYMNLMDECLHMCLHTLHCQRKIGLEYETETNNKQIHLIKIPDKIDGDTSITEADRAVHNLEMTQKNLLTQLDELEEEIKLNDNKARQHLQENKRQLAKTYLRKKHLLEKNHEKRSLALHNVETLLNNVNEAQSNGIILDAYKIGSKALQNMLDESGLKYDNVDEVISDVRETMENHKEVQDTIANANLADITMGADYDNDALEEELRDIMGEVTSNKKRPQVPPKIPNATTPTAPPTVKITDEELLAMLEDLEVEDASFNSKRNSRISE